MARHGRGDPELETFVVSEAALRACGIVSSEARSRRNDLPEGGLMVNAAGQAQTLTASGAHAVCIALKPEDIVANAGRRGSSTTSSTSAEAERADSRAAAFAEKAVRRLTPRECERLQGFPDDYTLIPYRGKPAADGPRYRALGNSMAVPVMRWLGERIQMIDDNFAAVRSSAE
jgi:DNA (cytosine-5)-methyltransferase 1